MHALLDTNFPREKINILSNLKLVDREFHKPTIPDILIGSGATFSLLCQGQIKIKDKSNLILQKTLLGWVIAGSIGGNNTNQSKTFNANSLTSLIKKFWDINEAEFERNDLVIRHDCEMHYVEHTKRELSGRYAVRLPFRIQEPELGNSREVALNRFSALKRKLDANPKLKQDYTQVIEEYLRLGHLEKVTDESNSGYYLPHRAVIKETSTTTKTRVVFDASSKTDRKISLNDVLLVGPVIQDKLFTHILRFRMHRYVLTADITQMYRQILVQCEDRRFLRIFWEREGELSVFQLTTVPFGLSPSSFLAIRTLHQLAEDERSLFPTGATALKENFYVDDFISGADSLSDLVEKRDQVINILAKGGFELRKFASNEAKALQGLDKREGMIEFSDEAESVRNMLGISWDAKRDYLSFTRNPCEISKKVTKRLICAQVAKIYDPSGLVEPVTLIGKNFVRQCWQGKLDWDESITSDLHTSWLSYVKQLPLLISFKVPRFLLSNDAVNIQIHGFSDASKKGYGACLYIRTVDMKGAVRVKLLCSKGRVSLLKEQTIPRLELCGALVMAKLCQEISSTVIFQIDRVILWTDSTIVLQWLKKHPSTLKTFESNRVAVIQELTENIEWRHVRTEDNPADSSSRREFPREHLKNRLWLKGPVWLSKSKESWPNTNVTLGEDIPGLRKIFCLAVCASSQEFLQKLLDSTSSFSRLIRRIGIYLKFLKYLIDNNKYKKDPENLQKKGIFEKNRWLSVKEIETAEKRFVGWIQRVYFTEELNRLADSSEPRSAKIGALNPFLDSEGLMRVGGRLRRAEIPYEQKHPLLIPSRNNFTDKLIRDYHERFFHTGITSTLYHLRQKYWITDAKGQIRKIIRGCARCTRVNPTPLNYLMGDQPKARVTLSRPFEATGIDFFGPLYAKERKYRNTKKIKTYGCIFVCRATKAVHIEVVGDLSTESFLKALERFVGRRGIPAEIYSDNGSNFVGANNKLRELYILLASDQFKGQVYNKALEKRINWRFIPPLSPHFGGLWESAVKSCKFHIKRAMGNDLYTFKEFATLAVQIEAIMNSRPFFSISTDPNDPIPITPGHFLIGRALTTLPEKDNRSVSANRLTRWEAMDKTKQEIWDRWSTDYLTELQTRQRWRKSFDNIKKGAIVILIDKNLPTMHWSLGRLEKLHPGEDGIVRVVTVKTQHGSYKRNLKTLCLLPTESEYKELNKDVSIID